MLHNLIPLSVLYPAKTAQPGAGTVTVDIAVVGKWKGHPSGPFEITADDLRTIKTNFDAQNVDVVIDYEHGTLWDSRAPAAGWIVGLQLDGDTLRGEVRWTEDAAQMSKREEYRYLSPVLDPHTIDPVSGEDIGWGLHSAALTNKPFLEELGEVRANKHQPQQKENGMTDEEKARLEEAQAKAAKVDELEAQLETLKTQNAALIENSAKVKVSEAIAAKKIGKDQEAWALKYAKDDPEGFDTFLAAAKPQTQVPGNDRFANSGGAASASTIKMTKV